MGDHNASRSMHAPYLSKMPQHQQDYGRTLCYTGGPNSGDCNIIDRRNWRAILGFTDVS